MGSNRSYVLVDAHPFGQEVIAVSEQGLFCRFNRQSATLISSNQSSHVDLVKCGVRVQSALWTGDVSGQICVWDLTRQCSPLLGFVLSQFSDAKIADGDPRYAALCMCTVKQLEHGQSYEEVWIGSAGMIHRFHGSKYTLLGEWSAHEDRANLTRLTTTSYHVWSTAHDGKVCVWNKKSGELVKTLTNHQGQANL
jgi:WD40 repeat protein